MSSEPAPSGGKASEEHEAFAETEAGTGRDAEALGSNGAEPTRIGRFVIMDKLGAGGMGAVYSAYDPKLQRVVAVKLLNVGGSEASASARERLVREAQAMAKLSHPNVLPVFEVDDHQGDPFVAMELVKGQTLRAWMASGAKSVPDVVEVFSQAAAGLIAAHAEGLVHRDFKPDNVMLGDEGRVRVMDFGLVRVANEVPVPATDDHDDSIDLTRTGAVMGTPAYMAPEQHAAAPTDERSDQFSFCVALWEALYGERPFAGATLASLAAAVIDGERRPVPAGRAVPAWLHRVCDRGLAIDPTHRFATMRDLVDALHRGQARRRRGRFAAGALALGGLAAAAYGYDSVQTMQAIERCEALGPAEIGRAWNPSAKERVRAALLATQVGFAETTATSVAARLDARSEAWADARTEVCLQQSVHHTLDATHAARTTWCLEQRATELALVVELLGDATPEVATQAVAAASGGLPPQLCLKPVQLQDPPEGDARETITQLRTELLRVSALDATAHHAEALEAAEAAKASADLLEDGALRAAADAALGEALFHSGRFDEAEVALERGYFAAARAGDLQTAATTATLLAYVVGRELARYADGVRWGKHADARMGEFGISEDDPRRASYFSKLGVVEYTAGHYAEAEPLFETALRLLTGHLGDDHPDAARVLGNLGMIESILGRTDSARQRYVAAIDQLRRTVGPEHPSVAAAMNNLAVLLYEQGEYEQAIALVANAVEIRTAALGAEHPDVAQALTNLAAFNVTAGHPDEAREAYARALAIHQKAFGPEHPNLAYALVGLGSLALYAHDPEEALPYFQRALAIVERAFGADHPEVATALAGVGAVYIETGELDLARASYERALAIRTATVGRDHPYAALVLGSLGLVALDENELDEARRLLDEALAVFDAVEGVQQGEPDARFADARLRYLQGERDGARSDARATLAALRDSGDTSSPLVRDIEQWLEDWEPNSP